MARLIYLLICLVIGLRLLQIDNEEQRYAALIVMGIGLAMVWFAEFWAKYFLAFGLMEYFAKDFKHPERSAGAIVFLGWLLLGAIGYFVFFA